MNGACGTVEDWIDIAVKAGGGAVTLALIAWILRPASLRGRREGGLRYVEYAPAFKALFVLMAGLVGFVGWALAAHGAIGPDDAPYVVGLGVGGALIMGLFGYMAFVYRIAWDDNFVHLRTLRHWGRRIPWDAVRSVAYSDMWQAWLVKTAGSGTIWIYRYQRGHGEFLEMAEARATRNAPA